MACLRGSVRRKLARLDFLCLGTTKKLPEKGVFFVIGLVSRVLD